MRAPTSKVVVAFTILTLVIFLGPLAGLHAGSTGKIAGRVTDARSGQPLPGANVTIEGTTLGAAANVEGEYFIINVLPGVYSVKAQYIGYGTVVKSDVRVSIDLTSTVNFALQEQTVTAGEVVVMAVRPVVQPDISGTERNIDIQEIAAGRFQNINNVITAQVGVNSVSSYEDRPEIRGSGFEESLFIVDGVVQGDPITNRPHARVNLDAIQEAKVQTGGFSARYGNLRSGITNIVTKEGTREYHGSINFQYSPPGLKHFGPMPFGFDSPLAMPFVDVYDANGNWDPNAPSNSGQGVTRNGDPISAFFDGWNNVATKRLKPGDPHYNKPIESYARWLWQHRSKDAINELKRLQAQGIVQFAPGVNPDDQAYFETGVDPDYRASMTLGGPVPALRNTTFFLTYDGDQMEYAYRFPQRTYEDNQFRGKLTTQLNNRMKLNLHGYWSRQKGGDGGQGPDIEGWVSNSPFRALGDENKFWYPHCAVPGQQTRQIYGLSLTHTLSSRTFYEVQFTHYRTDYEMLPEFRNTAPIPGTIGQRQGKFGPIYGNGLPSSGSKDGSRVVEGRIGTEAEAEARRLAGQPGWERWRDWAMIQIGGYWYDESPVGYGPVNWRDITGEYRMESCNLRFNDTCSRAVDFAINLTSQLNQHHLVDAGVQLRKDKISQLYETIDPSVNGGNLDLSNADEWRGGVYLEDKMEFQGLVANLGLRADWLRLSDYPQLDLGIDQDGNQLNAANRENGPYSTHLLPGNTVDENGNFNTFQVIPLRSETRIKLSPRLGISHPITDVAKIFFNYGHMYQWPSMFDRYRIRYNTVNNNRIDRYGNPALEPPRTIQYELAYEHNLLNKMLLRLTGYYKDINDEDGEARFFPLGYGSGDDAHYRAQLNQEFRDVRGLEAFLELRRHVVPYLSGWASVNYLVESRGEFGFDRFYEDPSRQTRPVSSQVSNPDVRPIIRVNLDLHTPARLGPTLGDNFSLFGGINLNLLYNWKRGPQFDWNPANIPLVEDNLRWKAYQRWDLRLTKDLFKAGSFSSVFYLDVRNLFNNRNMSHPAGTDTDNRTLEDYAWDGNKWWKNQLRGYLYSLGYTPENQNPDGSFNNTKGKPGDNKGDLPGFTPWTFLEKRDVFFGIRFYF